ncbi:hypothetical protein OZZ08_12820 [Malaciobacter mytili]|uniref:hypothetical protein n=1 Tax=Malaciobacter mytili TaxID=603050 RepID=UPI003BB0039D
MRKFLLSTSFITALLFSGCTTNSALKHFENKELNANALQFTKKSDIIVDNEPKVQFFATYLNLAQKDNDKEIESFLIGVYLVNQKNQNFLQQGYTLTLNGQEALAEPLEISPKSLMVKSLPIKNPWGKYYIAHFPQQEDFKLTLTLEKTNLPKAVLEYEK